MSSKIHFSWETFLAEVSKKISSQTFRAWIEPIQFKSINEKTLYLIAPTTFSRDFVLDQHSDTFREVFRSLYQIEVELAVEVADPVSREDSSDSSALLTIPMSQFSNQKKAMEQENSVEPESSATTEEQPSLFARFEPQSFGGDSSKIENQGKTHSQTPKENAPIVIVRSLGQQIDPKYTFETFVVGASNQFAHAAARAVAEQPAAQYNPLFVYSAAGLGKTHLLHAIANHISRNNPKARICYLSAEKFVNDLIDSIHHGKMSQFRERYRDGFDMLLMDDIQFIAGKDRSQEEFFHTFNTLHASKRQIVVTSDKFPKDIQGLEDRIRTRLEWGLVADIQPPEIETRIAILRAKAEMDDIFLPQDVAVFLASNIKTNIRELEGSLIRLGAQASLSGTEISLELARQLLKNVIKEPSTTVSTDSIQDAVAHHFEIKVTDLRSKERSRRVALPRQITMYLIRKYCGKSYPEIGELLGGKDHSTIVHGVKSIELGLVEDSKIKQHVEEIQNLL